MLSACAIPSLARADNEIPTADSAAEARQQYQLGTQAFQSKRYSEAALHFEAAAAFRAHSVALYTAGMAWDLASRPERAADAYARALEVGGLDPKQDKVARERVQALERSLGSLVVSAPEGTKVQLDTFTEVPTPARLHGPPGVHGLSIRAVGRPIERRDVMLEGGRVTTLDLKEEPKAPPKVDPVPVPPPAPKPDPALTAPPPPRESFWITRRVIGVGVGGVGVAALAATIILGINANGAKDAFDASPTRETYDHASSLQTWTNVALISGALLTAGGAALVLWPDRDGAEGRMRAQIGPTGFRLQGTF